MKISLFFLVLCAVAFVVCQAVKPEHSGDITRGRSDDHISQQGQEKRDENSNKSHDKTEHGKEDKSPEERKRRDDGSETEDKSKKDKDGNGDKHNEGDKHADQAGKHEEKPNAEAIAAAAEQRKSIFSMLF